MASDTIGPQRRPIRWRSRFEEGVRYKRRAKKRIGGSESSSSSVRAQLGIEWHCCLWRRATLSETRGQQQSSYRLPAIAIRKVDVPLEREGASRFTEAESLASERSNAAFESLNRGGDVELGRLNGITLRGVCDSCRKSHVGICCASFDWNPKRWVRIEL